MNKLSASVNEATARSIISTLSSHQLTKILRCDDQRFGIVDHSLHMWDSYMLPTINEYMEVDGRVQDCLKYREQSMYLQLCNMEDIFYWQRRRFGIAQNFNIKIRTDGH